MRTVMEGVVCTAMKQKQRVHEIRVQGRTTLKGPRVSDSRLGMIPDGMSEHFISVSFG
jgi:hypothetical protein